MPIADCVPWELDTSCCDGWDEIDPALQDRAAWMAWETLRALTAGRVGACRVTMRPCLTPPCDLCAVGWMNPMVVNGVWVNTVCGAARCSCGRLCEISFPGSVAQIDEVQIDGVALDPSAYRVDNGGLLVRQDGQCWPSCQDMAKPLGEARTMGVTYVPGIVPGASGQLAAGALACEFTKACSGAKCRLPAGVTTVARQGVVLTLGAEMWPGGLTGVREADTFIYSVNPHGLKTPSRVWSPDLPAHRYQTAR